MNEVAANIVRRANARGISVAHLCREVGVSRAWFEYFKRRVPESVDVYIKIERFLSS